MTELAPLPSTDMPTPPAEQVSYGEGVVEFVLQNVAQFENLNAADLAQGDEVFRHHLADALGQKGGYFGRLIGEGASFVVTKPDDMDDVAIKRLQVVRGLEDVRPDLHTLEEYWEALQQEHAIATRYFGRFIPHTEFIALDTPISFGPGYEPYMQRTYLMVQDEIKGDSVDPRAEWFSPGETSEGLKHELEDFIVRYETMMHAEGLVIEDQIMIDFSSGTIKVSDTNNFISYNNQVNRGKVFLDNFAISPESVASPSQLHEVLVSKIPALASLQGYSSLREAIAIGGEPSSAIAEAKAWIDANYGQQVLAGFEFLLGAVNYFAPEGEHNVFVTSFIEKFGLEKDNLRSRTTPAPPVS